LFVSVRDFVSTTSIAVFTGEERTCCLKRTCTVPYGVGRLIQTVSNGTTVQYSQFDPNGRVLQQSQSNPQMNGGNAAQFSYVYNLAVT